METGTDEPSLEHSINEDFQTLRSDPPVEKISKSQRRKETREIKKWANKENLLTDVKELSNERPAKNKHQIHNDVKGIVLAMIVKNESKIMPRCLTSAKPVISGVCITDTGSNDNCVEVIENWCRENNIPCEVPVRPYTKKTFSFDKARTVSYLHALKYFPQAKYYLLLDADMELVVEANWNIDDLDADGYKLYQQTFYSRYQNLRMIKPRLKWRCVCVTHEYWECETPVTYKVLHSLWIRDNDDGGCKEDKYIRDKRLMLKALADKKTPAHHIIRYRFYLGQTYLCLKEYEKSIEQYRKRIELGGWIEECWYSWYKIGEAYMAMEKNAEAIDAYLEAWNYHPERAEPLLKIAEHYRKKSKNAIAFHFAKLAQDLGYPHEDALFIDSQVYRYLIDNEIAINAFYVPGKKPLGYQSHMRLKENLINLPEYIKSIVLNNDKFYQC